MNFPGEHLLRWKRRLAANYFLTEPGECKYTGCVEMTVATRGCVNNPDGLGKPEFAGYSGHALFYFAPLREANGLASRLRFFLRVAPEEWRDTVTFGALYVSRRRPVHQHTTLPLRTHMR